MYQPPAVLSTPSGSECHTPKPLLDGAIAVWEELRGIPAARRDPPVPNKFDSLFGGEQQQEGGREGRESARSTIPPPNASRRTGPRGPTAAEWQANQGGATAAEYERADRAESTDFGSAIRALVEVQSTAQIALAITQHTNLIALHTATTQALATKSGDKDSKLTAAKWRILQACAGTSHVDEFEAEPVFWEMDAEGETRMRSVGSFGSASGRSHSPPTKPTSTSPPS